MSSHRACTRAAVAAALLLAGGAVGLVEPSEDERPPAGSATLYRDDWGVVHVYAQREADGHYGLGYAMAEDRLETILHRWLWAEGRLAEAFGRNAKLTGLTTTDVVESDMAMRRWHHVEEARAGFQRMSPRLQSMYRSFVAGIQRYMDEHPDRVPAWAGRLEPTLPVLLTRAWQWGVLVAGAVERLKSLDVPLDPDVAQILEPAFQRTGSNGWAVMPWRTAENVTIHLSDPHISFEGIQEVYEFRMDAGPQKMCGYLWTGVPWLFMGHTRHLAWGITSGAAELADVYSVEVDQGNARRFLYDGQWREMTTETVRVSVRGEPPATRAFDYTRHNGVLSPVLGRKGTTAYVVSSPHMHLAGSFDEQYYQQQNARNLSGFVEAASKVSTDSDNFVVADSSGNIMYFRPGRVPQRPPGFDWRRPLPGNTSETEWLGVHPFADLIQLINPAAGYLQANNVSPDRVVEGSPLTADRYPDYMFNDRPGRNTSRGSRASDLLSRAYHLTDEEAMAIAMDEKLVWSERWLEALRRALVDQPDKVRGRSGEHKRFLHSLLSFDGIASRDSVGALQYFHWRTALAGDSNLAEGALSALGDAVESGSPLSSLQHDALIRAADGAVSGMTEKYGSIAVRFGDVFRIGRGGHSYPMGAGAFRAGDRYVTSLRQFWFKEPDDTGQRWAFLGQRQPLLTVFSDPVRSYSQLNWGNSLDPSSPHYTDQARLVSERRFKSTYFDRRELLRHLRSARTLTIPRD